MKKIFTLLALTISFSMNAQISTIGTNNSGDIASAMGYETTASGSVSTAIGYGTTASGLYSTAMGLDTTASGNFASIAMGSYTIASGDASTAMGNFTIASGSVSTAMGGRTTASGGLSTAMGEETIASDRASLVIGQYNLLGSTTTNANSSTVFSAENTAFVIGNGIAANNRSDALTILFDGTTNVAGSVTATSFIGDGSQLTNLASSSPFSFNEDMQTAIQSPWSTASGNYSNAFGNSNIASGYAALAMGSFSEAIGQNSVTIGGSTKAIGNFSTAIGNTTVAEDLGTTAIGYWNSLDETPNPYEFSLQNTAFVIGNGGFDSDGNYIGTDESRSDAFVVKFNGDATLAGNLSVNSDAKLKSNIISLGSTLAKVLMLDGKSYSMKNDPESSVKIGLVAQNIEQIFPELVSESNGIKSVNYQGLIPVLINAVKEQDEIIKKQDERLAKLEQVIANMNE